MMLWANGAHKLNSFTFQAIHLSNRQMNKLFWWLYFIISQRFAHLFKWALFRMVWNCLKLPNFFFFRLSELFLYPLLGRARFRGRCWAANRLSHRPEPSGYAVHGEVDGLDIGGQHGRRFVLLRHTHRPQRRPYHICTSRSGNVRHWCGGG